MQRGVVVAVAVLGALLVGGFAVTYVVKVRAAAADAGCKNNLRELALFAALHNNPKPGRDDGRFLHEIPAGTVVLPGVAPADRLSWVVPSLPGLDQRRQDVAAVLAAVDRAQPWAAAPNQQAATARLVVLLCPAAPAEAPPDAPAPTQYLGIAGLGADAAALALTSPPSPRAGCFRYDAPTPFAVVAAGDGLSQSLLFGERAADVGPWLRGGPATVRGLDDAAGAPPYVGPGGQFGGCHTQKANWAFADGAVRFLTDRVDPAVLARLATIAGGAAELTVGE
jgi:prepilin-type processing-associated H-X9-DG protein